MKTKVNVMDEIKKLVNKLNEKGASGTFFSVYCDAKSHELAISMNDNDDELVCVLASIIATGYGKNCNEEDGMARAAKALVRAVGIAASGNPFNQAGLSVMLDITQMILANNKPNSDDKEDEQEDCEHCENNRVCPLPDAIAYRKANGIRKPKRKKHTQKEKAN